MKVLFDHNVPRKLRRSLSGHDVRLAREEGWSTLENGRLLKAAEDSGFEVMLTADKNLSYQQNLQGRRLAILVLSTNNWQVIQDRIEPIAGALLTTQPGSFQFIDLAV